VSFFTFVSVGCSVSFDQFDRVVVMTAGPLCVIGAVLGMYALLCAPEGSFAHRYLVPAYLKAPGTERLQNWRTRLFHAALYVSYLCLPAASSEVAKCFRCDSFDDGTSVLGSDYTIDCHSTRYTKMRSYASFMLAVFPVGIPLWYLFLLWRHRDIIYHRNSGRQVSRCFVLVQAGARAGVWVLRRA
jgi:hypothetical protein